MQTTLMLQVLFMKRHWQRICLMSGILLLSGVISVPSIAQAASILIGSSPYLSFSDSPFYNKNLDYFYLEDFEDNLMNTPGVTANAGFAAGYETYSTFIDSVDGDDGNVDGVGYDGRSYVTWNVTKFVFSFDPVALGELPTHAGIVWTDSAGGFSNVSFEAFDENADSLGVIGPVLLGDGSTISQTDEDRFFGIINDSGISRIEIYNSASTNWEVDHLQYGGQALNAIPEPTCLMLIGTEFGVLALIKYRRKRK